MPRTKYATDGERILRRVSEDENGCWRWTDRLTDKGYGRLNVGGQTWRAHRFAYVTFVGPIPAEMTIDHLCRNRACVNPEHLEAVTQAENVLRSPESIPSINAAKTKCRSGHNYDAANTYYTPSGGRRCRICRADSLARYYARVGGAYAARKARALRAAGIEAAA